jgi:hypothetical protein
LDFIVSLAVEAKGQTWYNLYSKGSLPLLLLCMREQENFYVRRSNEAEDSI